MQNTRTSYKTKQKDLILDFLRERESEHVTADMIVESLKGEVGKTTIYRNLDKLVKQGVVLKYDMPNGMSACFQYSDRLKENTNYHFLCTQCGEITHVNCNFFDKLTLHMEKEHGFWFDSIRTVFHGCCENCMSK